ncbi:MAG: hypothetical protein JSU63_05340 [Phycisphaerales bacterium]|nr:MAG: hypothetical protein JSU63_05340 [Phycisphaerales bacterium]
MGTRRSDDYPPELRARVRECISLFADGMETVTAEQVRDVLWAAEQRGIADVCAHYMLDNNLSLYQPIHNALQELWVAQFTK